MQADLEDKGKNPPHCTQTPIKSPLSVKNTHKLKNKKWHKLFHIILGQPFPINLHGKLTTRENFLQSQLQYNWNN